MDRHATARDYVPALRFSVLTRFYDTVIRVALKEDKFRNLLLEQAKIGPGHRVLDLGCGTGTLTVMAKRATPQAHVVGLDGDPEVLAIARKKAIAQGVEIELCEAMAYDPPFEANSFDRILSSLVFHHLTTANKGRALARARELLRSGGELHIADWGKPQNTLMRAAFLGVQMLDGFETTGDNVHGLLPEMIRGAGFVDVQETHREMTVFGTLSLYRAVAACDDPIAQQNS